MGVAAACDQVQGTRNTFASILNNRWQNNNDAVRILYDICISKYPVAYKLDKLQQTSSNTTTRKQLPKYAHIDHTQVNYTF